VTDNRRRPKRGVRLSDLPDDVVRDLGELLPEGEEQPNPITGSKRQPRYGRKRSQPIAVSIHGGKRMTEATKAALVEVAKAGAKIIAREAAATVKPPTRRQKSCSEFDFQLRTHGYKAGTDFVRELKFAKDDEWEARGWRFDFALPKYRLAIEIEGLVVRMMRDIITMKPMRVVTGRHATITGIREDCHKYAAAEILGWHVIRVEQDMVASGDAIAFVERFVARWRHEQQAASAKPVAKKPRRG
jgi:very-short-patch-repair endonuclease